MTESVEEVTDAIASLTASHEVQASLQLAGDDATEVSADSMDSVSWCDPVEESATPHTGSGMIDEATNDKLNEVVDISADSGNDDPDDVTSRAAVALAAVAAAATANNSSPSAAAEAARALAPGIAPEASVAAYSSNPIAWLARKRDTSNVDSSVVKQQLLKRIEAASTADRDTVAGLAINVLGQDSRKSEAFASPLIRKLAIGGNDSFLHYLLVLACFRGTDEDGHLSSDSAICETGNVGGGNCRSHDSDKLADSRNDQPATEAKEKENELSSQACDVVCSMVVVIVDAYGRLLRPQSRFMQEMADDKSSVEATAASMLDTMASYGNPVRDATLEFFLACQGEYLDTSNTEKGLRNASVEDPFINGDLNRDNAEPASTNSASASSSRSSHAMQEAASSVLSSVFSSVKRSTKNSPGRQSTLAGVFRKRNRLQLGPSSGKNIGGPAEVLPDATKKEDNATGEYMVQIDREMLGLTVENVLERTVVRTVLPGGAAKKAGAKVGSLIVKVGNVETKNLTHFETIDELRQSQRPLKLVLRQISNNSLRAAREEMGRLIRGGGFSVCTNECREGATFEGRPGSKSQGMSTEYIPPKIVGFSEILHSRWNRSIIESQTLKDESVARAGEKLVWILTMLIAGLELESVEMSAFVDDDPNDSRLGVEPFPLKQIQNYQNHKAKDYADASKSVSKVLLDFLKEKLNFAWGEPEVGSEDTSRQNSDGRFDPTSTSRRGRKTPPGGNSVGRSSSRTCPERGSLSEQCGVQQQPPASTGNESSTKSLLRIGDVLHRTRTFLADTNSPPASLLRGEIIAFLCDVLDVDTDMELSEEEAASSIAGHKAGPINDLGSAGSLLKLIILNCSTMREIKPPPAFERASSNAEELIECQGLASGLQRSFCESDLYSCHAGNRFMAVVHRLAASRSTSARVTACSLGPVLWGHLDFPHQLQLRGVITRALHDAEVIVRKSTATVLHEIAELVFDPRAVPWLVLMCERVMTDPEPQLRAAAMTLTWHLAEHLPNAFLGDASKGSRSLRRLPPRTDPTFSEVYLLQCKLLPVATRLADDRAPSVRLAVAAQCDRLCNALGEHWTSVIIDLLQALLADPDERVRSEAILCVPRLVEIVLVSSSPDATPTGGVGVLEALLPVSIKLIRDPSASVRVSLATSAGELLTLLVGLESLEEISSPSNGDASPACADLLVGYKQHKKHVDETLIPLVQKLLHDPDPEVTSSALRAVTNASRGNVREIRTRRNSTASDDDTLSLSSYHSHTSAEKKEPVFIPVLSETQVLRLLPTLSDLANSRQWRVRQSAVEIVPALLGCTHRLQTRSEISQLCVRLMGDTVDAVRRTAAECLCLGGGSLGSLGEDSSGEWISAIVLPHLRKCSQSNDSKQRMLSLKMVEVILLNGVCPLEGVGDSESSDRLHHSPLRELVDVATSLSNDRTVNVRLNVGRVMGNIMHMFEEPELRIIEEALLEQIRVEQTRQSGGDKDVLYFAECAVCKARMRLEEVGVPPESCGG